MTKIVIERTNGNIEVKTDGGDEIEILGMLEYAKSGILNKMQFLDPIEPETTEQERPIPSGQDL